MLRAFCRTTSLVLLGLTLSGAPALADTHVYIGTRPPRPIVEIRPTAPRPGWVWRPGYHHWNGHRYVWVRGRWVRPPYRNAVWSEGRWNHEHRGWYWVPGHWARR